MLFPGCQTPAISRTEVRRDPTDGLSVSMCLGTRGAQKQYWQRRCALGALTPNLRQAFRDPNLFSGAFRSLEPLRTIPALLHKESKA